MLEESETITDASLGDDEARIASVFFDLAAQPPDIPLDAIQAGLGAEESGCTVYGKSPSEPGRISNTTGSTAQDGIAVCASNTRLQGNQVYSRRHGRHTTLSTVDNQTVTTPVTVSDAEPPPSEHGLYLPISEGTREYHRMSAPWRHAENSRAAPPVTDGKAALLKRFFATLTGRAGNP
jgi:hypothetical protein